MDFFIFKVPPITARLVHQILNEFYIGLLISNLQMDHLIHGVSEAHCRAILQPAALIDNFRKERLQQHQTGIKYIQEFLDHTFHVLYCDYNLKST